MSSRKSNWRTTLKQTAAIFMLSPALTFGSHADQAGWDSHKIEAPFWPWQSHSQLEQRIINLVEKHYDDNLAQLPRGGVVVKWYQGRANDNPRTGSIIIGAKRMGLPWWRSLGMSDGAINASRIDNLRFEIGSVTKALATSLVWLADLEKQPGHANAESAEVFDINAPAQQYLYSDIEWPRHSDDNGNITEITPLHMATHSAFSENLGLIDKNLPRLFVPEQVTRSAIESAAISAPFSLLAGDTKILQVALQRAVYKYDSNDARSFLLGTDDPEAKFADFVFNKPSDITDLKLKPGTQFSYDQLGLGLLGPMMAEHYAGDANLFGEVLHDKIFAPLGMHHSSFHSDWFDANRTKGYNTVIKDKALWSPNPGDLKQHNGEFWTLAAGGSLDSTPGDLFRFMLAALGDTESLGSTINCSLYLSPNAPELCNVINAIQLGFNEPLHNGLLPDLELLNNKPFLEGGAGSPGHQQLSTWSSKPISGNKSDDGYRVTTKGGVAMGHLSLIKFSSKAEVGVVIQQNVFSPTFLGELGDKVIQELAASYDD